MVPGIHLRLNTHMCYINELTVRLSYPYFPLKININLIIKIISSFNVIVKCLVVLKNKKHF